jgi:hypothetical protein
MTVEELEQKIIAKEKSIACGFKHDELSFKILRNCKGEKVYLAPGIFGRIVQWGGKDSPTIFMVKLEDAKRLLDLMKRI